MTTSIRRDYSKAELAAVVAAVCIGELGLLTMPFVVGGVAERFDLSAGGAGLVSVLQFASMSSAALALMFTVHRVDRRKLALAAVILTLIADAVAAFSSQWSWFLASRVAMGVGEGTLLTIGSAAAAGTLNPQRTFSLVTLGYVLVASAIFLSWPYLHEHYGGIAVFYIVLIGAVVGSPFLLAIPRLEVATGAANDAPGNIWRPFPWILVGIACLYMGVNSLWAFSERMGVSLGLDHNAIIKAFLAVAALTWIGPIAANFLQRRWGYRKPIVFGVLIQAMACFVFGGAQSFPVYFVSFVILNIALLFLVPVYRALTAVLDPAGRLAAGSIVVQTVSTAVGPFVASLALLAGGGYFWVGAYATVLALLSGVLAWGVARYADRL
jgi:MFS transporter, DHA1 family, inner membrane transport protein